MSNYPKSLRVGGASSAFERAPELYALHTSPHADSAQARSLGAPVAVVSDGAKDEFAVYPGPHSGNRQMKMPGLSIRPDPAVHSPCPPDACWCGSKKE